jgi:hypothetical protein
LNFGGSKGFLPDINKACEMENIAKGILYTAIYGEVNVSLSVCVEIKGDYIEK